MSRCVFPNTPHRKSTLDKGAFLAILTVSTVHRGKTVIEIFWLAVHGVLGYFAFQLILAWWTSKKVEELNQTLDEFNEHIIICRVEEQDGMFYFWNVLDDTFVGQAKTVPEIAALSERLQKQLLMEEGDKDLLDKLQKMVRETYEVRSESTVR